jgi:OOP family OmpA-OmpF porin
MTAQRIKLFCLIFCLGLGMLVLFSPNLWSQEKMETEETIFQQTRDNIAKAKNQLADILSPKNYENALKEYEKAYVKFKKGGELKEIQNGLIQVQAYLDQALKISEVAKVSFASVLESREKALKANAPEYAPELYEVAKKTFREAALKIEAGDLKKAQEKSPQVQEKFRQAELQAIKVNLLGNAQATIEKAKAEAKAGKYAPATLQNAEELLRATEDLLNAQGTATEDAQQKAEQSAYQARHSIYLANKIKEMKADYPEMENLILEQEELISKIAQEISYYPQFDSGSSKPVSSILLAIENLKNEKAQLAFELQEQNKKLSEEQEKLFVTQQKLAEKEASYQEKIAQQEKELSEKKLEEEKFNILERLFSKEEATVLREGDNIIIRLYSISFPSGKSTILPEAFPLLTKVQRAIREYPNRKIVIQGHTDSQGDESYNQQLSEERAKAVTSYLIANMGLTESQINYMGYGEAQPMGSNDTKEGRALNRRIDVILSK